MTRRSISVLLLWLAVLAGAALLVARARFSADMSAFLPRAPDAQQRVLVEQLRDGLVSRVVMVGIDGATPRLRAALSKAMASRLRASAAFASVQNGGSGADSRDFAFAFAHRYVLGAGTTPQAFSGQALHHSIADAIARLASPMSEGLQHLLPTDPTDATLRFLGSVAPSSQPRMVDGAWASPDGSRALLLLITRARGTDTDAQQQALAEVRAAFDAARAAGGAPAHAATLVLGGPPVFAVYSRHAIERGVARVSVLGGVLIVALLLLVYRSPWVLLLGLLPVLSGILVATAVVGLGFGVVQGVTLGFGITLMGEAVDYSIYWFVQSADFADVSDGVSPRRQWLRESWPTVRLGMLTSLVGFAFLLLSDFPGLAQIGAFSMAGLLAAALATRFVLPLLAPRGAAVRDLSRVGGWLLRAAARLRGLRWLPGVLVLASAALLLVQRHHVWNDRLGALSPMPRALLDTDAALRRQLGAPDGSEMVALHGATRQAVLQGAEALAPRLRLLQRDGAIGGFDSPARYLPSERTQRERRRALPDPTQLRSALRDAVVGLPVRASLFEPFVGDVAAARAAPPLREQDFAHTSFALALDAMLLRGSDGRWTALMPLRAPPRGTIDVAAVRLALRGTAARFVDLGATSNALYRGYLHTAIGLCLGGVAAMSLLLLLALGSARRAARVLAPLLAAVLVVAATLVLLGQALTLLHLVGMMLVVAVGSNYALFFDRGESRGGIAGQTLASLVFANLSTVAGFGPLLVAGVPVLAALGATVGPGALLALLFSAMLSAPADEA